MFAVLEGPQMHWRPAANNSSVRAGDPCVVSCQHGLLGPQQTAAGRRCRGNLRAATPEAADSKELPRALVPSGQLGVPAPTESGGDHYPHAGSSFCLFVHPCTQSMVQGTPAVHAATWSSAAGCSVIQLAARAVMPRQRDRLSVASQCLDRCQLPSR